jgi:cytochrome P450/NADPH-dependent glutamate synthase beta subunit-like oxidoreductase/flavodoxin
MSITDLHVDENAGTVEAPVADWVSIPQLYTDPFPTFERLRAEGGVHWVPAVNRYLITSYSAVHQTELDQQTFSADEEGSLMKKAMGHPMLRKDDPEHHPERRAYMPTLKPATVKKTWTSIFHRNAERYLRELKEKGPGADLVWDFAAPFTAESLRAITGLHNVTQQDLQRWSQCLIDATGNYADDPEVWARGRQAFDEVDDAIDEMIPWHLDHPDQSLLSGLLSFPDYRMPLESIRSNLKMTIGGGLNEPRDAIGVATWALLTHPEQRALTEDGTRWHAVFDEGIRWIAPIGMYSRQTTREVVLDGVRLPAGAKLGICLLSANRDEAQWSHPERFDITRTGEGAHLAFGKGVHVCAGAWVARAQVADVALPALFSELPGLRLHPDRPAVPGGWVFRGMDQFPVVWDEPRRRPASPARSAEPGRTAAPVGTGRHIAVVGAGPAGCYTAQALHKALPGAEVTVLDRRPAPFGLLRSGVAGDHQGTKAIAEQFSSMFLSEDVRFVGSTAVRHGEASEDVVLSGRPGVFGPALRSQDAAGAEVTLEQLRERFDAVVLATGLHGDRVLGVEGADLAGVVGAGVLTRWLNGDPAECTAVAEDAHPLSGAEPLGEAAVVVGMGNVAMDVVRLLAKSAEQLGGSDVHEDAHSALTSGLRRLHVLGRSAPTDAAFDPVMLREIAALPDVEHVVHGVDEQQLRAAAEADPKAVATLALLDADPGQARIRIDWWFGVAPARLTGQNGRVVGVDLEPTGKLAGAEGASIEADAVVTAIGFQDQDGACALLAQDGLDDDARETGRVEDGLYVAGWARRGPQGTIPSQRTDARELATRIALDLAETAETADAAGQEADDVPGADGVAGAGQAAGPASYRGEHPARGLAGLRPYLGRASDIDGWLRIDQYEVAEAPEGRPRRKIADARRQRLLAVAAWDSPRPAQGGADTVDPATAGYRQPLTVLFGTESGNAEVVAEALSAQLADVFEVTVADLDDTDPSGLERSRVHVVVSSTYGDGELPTSARTFHARLSALVRTGQRPLDGVRVAMFGLGDRTYGATYSRGIDLMREALVAAGAEQIGQTGRHDAATGQAAAVAARQWVDEHRALLLEQAAAAADTGKVA